ncbi:TonB-dependent receptor [Sphingosinicella soli]|uniref:Iron complex outermembrane receptor protein n=1 Tax=Sphingosinicella soli TaxID=333708 RepID=A0A7W7F6Q8_9SPHN|nr:TonB-dependent receptor [Sphingosinicella soli]MBB4631984.1 iron complex outermembrane receptor protein [Sphingosinicella soli]
MSYNNNTNVGRIVLMAGASLLSSAAWAQQEAPVALPQAEEALGLDEILVTARRRTESLQSVPVSVTALSNESLRAQSIQRVTDLTTTTPNLTVSNPNGSATSTIIAIRGQVQTDIISTLDPSVGTYVDGIYLARPYGANIDLVDVERVEVLKGPQGTLFGRNTTGGALNIITADPKMGEFSGLVRATYGNYEQTNGEVVLNVPLSDKISFRGAGQYAHNKGFAKNLFDGKRLGSDNSFSVRGKLRAQPADALDMVLSVSHFRVNQATNPQRLIEFEPGGIAEIYVGLVSGGTDDIANYVNLPFYQTSLGFPHKSYARATNAQLTSTLDTGIGTFKSIVGYRATDAHSSIDLDATPYQILDTRTRIKGFEQYSGELNLTSAAFNDKLVFTTGLFAFYESGNDGSSTIALPLFSPGTSDTYVDVTATSYAAYFQGTFSFTDQFSFTGGIRYSTDHKTMSPTVRNNVGTPLEACVLPIGFQGDNCRTTFKRRDNGVSYTAGLEYKPVAGILIYGKTSRGFRSGGFNQRGSTFIETFAGFEPEEVTDYELGFKSDLFDRRVRLNLAAFYSDYKNIQRSTPVALAGGAIGTIVGNAASGHVSGGEAELTVLVADELRLSGRAGYTNAKYDEYPYNQIDPLGVITVLDRSNEPFQNIPKWTLGGSINYNRTIGSGTFNAFIDYSYISKRYGLFGVRADDPDATAISASKVVMAGYGLISTRVSYAMDSGLELAVFARNLANKKYDDYKEDLVPFGLGLVNQQSAPPRRYGIEATYRF